MLSISARLFEIMNWFTHAMAWARILGLWCWKWRRNFGMSISKPDVSNWSWESSHIFCRALNAPSQAPYSDESSFSHKAGNRWGHVWRPLFETIVVIRIPTVARIKGDGSAMQFKHSRLINSRHQSGNLSKKARALFFRIRPLKERVASSIIRKKVYYYYFKIFEAIYILQWKS